MYKYRAANITALAEGCYLMYYFFLCNYLIYRYLYYIYFVLNLATAFLFQIIVYTTYLLHDLFG